MPRIDTDRFPTMIIEVPVEQFPDEIKIFIVGRNIVKEKAVQLTFEAYQNLTNTPPLEDTRIYTENDFKKTSPDGSKKIAKVKTPFNSITSVRGWASRNDFDDTTPINVNVYTTTQSGRRSSRKNTTANNGNERGPLQTAELNGVFSVAFTMQKQPLTATYCIDYIINGSVVAEAATTLNPLIQQFIAGFGLVLAPQPPSLKAIGSKFLGPAAAQIQSLIAVGVQQFATIKPIADQVTAITLAVTNFTQAIASGNPTVVTAAAFQYLPILFNFLFELVPKEDVAKAIPDFTGG